MPTSIPHRKIKARFRVFLTFLALFLITLLVCIGIFLFMSLRFSPLSPIARVFGKIPTGSIASAVKTICIQDHISCAQVEQTDATTITLTLDNGVIVMLTTQKDLTQQLASLQQVLSQLTIKGKQLKKIDFRFTNAVISF